MNTRKQAAFTLVEMVITLAIAAILLTIGVPEMRAYVLNQRLTTQSNALVKHMNLARSEAITRNKQQGVILTSKGSGGNWSDGWWTWEDGRGSTANINGNRDAEEIIREASAVGQVDVFARDALTDGNAVDAVSYRSDGMLGGITEVHFFVCDAEKDRPGRYLRVRRTGRVSLENDQYTGAPCF